MRGTTHLRALAALALLMTAWPLAAQTRGAATAVILGTVGDTNLHPIAGVDVAFAGSNVHVASDSLGRFRIVRIPAGRYALVARGIGYRPATNFVDVADGDTLRLTLTLGVVPHELAPILVTERGLSPRLHEFEYRRKLGFGQFFTRADIDRINPIGIGDVLRRAISVRVSPNGAWALSARYGCLMAIYLDGIALGARSLDDLPSPNEIAAIEVYAGSATLPVWLPNGPLGTKKGCGAILLWTRDGS